MTNIEISPYQLRYKDSTRTRQGMLLRVHDAEGRIGYADCHPWVELGDAPLETQIAQLKQGKTTPLTARSLFFANLDATARAQKVNLLAGCTMVPNHWLFADITRPIDLATPLQLGFTTFKVKIGHRFSEEKEGIKRLMQQLPAGCTVSFDSNYRLSQAQFEELHRSLQPYHHQISYYEDPFPFDQKNWQDTQKRHGIPFAHDRGSEESIGHLIIAPIIIHKPAIQDEHALHALHPQQKLAFTSYLDHPLGQLTAAYVAAKWFAKCPQQVTICGLLSHLVYEPTPFSEQLHFRETCLQIPTGTGFGLDKLLQTEQWSPL